MPKQVIIIIVCVLLMLLAGGGAAYYFMTRPVDETSEQVQIGEEQAPEYYPEPEFEEESEPEPSPEGSSESTPEELEEVEEEIEEVEEEIEEEVVPSLPTVSGKVVEIKAGGRGCYNITELEVYGADGVTNISQGKEIFMSTVYGNGPAGPWLVDGNLSGNAHSNCEDVAVFKVDLGSVQKISKIVVYNRTDCCGGRTGGSVIKIYDSSNNVKYTSDPFPGYLNRAVYTSHTQSGPKVYTLYPPNPKVGYGDGIQTRSAVEAL